MIKMHEIGFVAGLLEGEGSFCYDDDRHRPYVSMASTDVDTVRKYRRLIGRLDKTISSYKNGNNKTMYRLVIMGSSAIQWMMTVYPMLCDRRKAKIREVIGKWMNSTIHNSMKTHCLRGHSLNGLNLFIRSNGSRGCKICRVIRRSKVYLDRRREERANA